MAEPVRLTMAILNHGQWDALRDGMIQPKGIALEQIDVEQPPMIYRRMVRNLEFDVAEVAITTFLCARSFGIPITALPVFTNRDLTMTQIVSRVASGIRAPKDLEGKRVGMRSYTVTNNTQARALLNSELGVDTNRVTWVVTEDAHVAEYREPPNVQRAPSGKSLEEMLQAGEIDAGIQLRIKPGGDFRALLSEVEADEVGVRYLRRTGVYPIGHIMTVKDATLRAHPWIAEELFRAFKASKDAYVAGLDTRPNPGERDRQSVRNREIVGGDPLPFGLPRNRASMEGMVRWNVDQQVIRSPLDIDSLFAAGTHELD
ncbi:MAG: 4,5-dihydroxyphthalate decarboxylase [Chloroflexota bacterium]|jgi:4,5-dihydroxyphthalate decarboxylase|nr:4,5-dihydroxyphthalate decarboxylase [Chloroflexota bacterium]